MAVIIDMDKPDNCHDCPMCEASRLPFWCMALSEKLPFDRNEIYKSIASDCPLKSTADVQPVIHAKWIRHYAKFGEGGDHWKCSECGAEFECFDMDFEWCPRCGAKMVWLQESEDI